MDSSSGSIERMSGKLSEAVDMTEIKLRWPTHQYSS